MMPVHPGRILRRELEARGLSANRLANTRFKGFCRNIRMSRSLCSLAKVATIRGDARAQRCRMETTRIS